MLEVTGNQNESSEDDGSKDGAGDGGEGSSENQNSAGEDGGKSGSEGSENGQQSDGGDGGNEEGESTQDLPTGESLLDLFRKDPKAQELVRAQAETWASSQQTAAAVQKTQQEIDGLIEDEDFEELGKRFAKDTVTNRAGKVQADAALQEAFGGVYKELFALPELQNLTAEEREKIDASRFKSDATYIPAILELVVKKRVGGTLEDTVNGMLEEKLLALQNMSGAGTKDSSGSPNIPAGSTSNSLEGKSSRELLSAGWAEVLSKAGYATEDDD